MTSRYCFFRMSLSSSKNVYTCVIRTKLVSKKAEVEQEARQDIVVDDLSADGQAPRPRGRRRRTEFRETKPNMPALFHEHYR